MDHSAGSSAMDSWQERNTCSGWEQWMQQGSVSSPQSLSLWRWRLLLVSQNMLFRLKAGSSNRHQRDTHYSVSIRIFLSLLTSLVSVLPLFHHRGTSVTLSRCSALSCAFLSSSLSSPTNHNHHPSSPPCAAWGRVRVRTCRLPLFWVRAIQFSGCCKPAQCPTTCTFSSSCLLDIWCFCSPAHVVLKVAEITNLSLPVGTLDVCLP